MNIAQLAYLCAMKCNISRIVFCGNFLRQKENKISMLSISYSIDYWSKGTMKACFLKHEGYMGSMGAFVLRNSNSFETSSSQRGSSSEQNDEHKRERRDEDGL